MATRREHIEEIRMTKFSIGGELNPLTEDLHQAVKNLSAELYAKDVHFLMELIQNAEDNEYSEGVDPSLEFVITSRDITGTGAPATLLVFNNEKGFSPKNIESICSVGRSTKKGNRKRGYIGEKGIGFKSVFLITAQPYIFSNGYQIRFSEEPCMHCNLGYIVPEWVEENPTLSDIRQIYGSGSALPTTTLILPLKLDKVKPVKQQLSRMHPEVLLFLAKVKRLSVREVNEDPRLNTVTAISISSETDFETRKNMDADSYTLHLSAEENGNELETECSYYMWKQKFPVKQDCRDEKRMEVDEWVITLAFPYGERLNRGTSSPGIYAFLPTEMITNLPFIIQADFLLASSRENILLDKKWNQGILNCVPSAFINAFLSLVRTVEDAPVSSLPPFFRFLPVQSSHYHELNVVRESIKARLVEEDIVPCEPHKGQKFFHKPREVGRLLPAFWNILRKAREVGVSLPNLSSHGKYILCHSFDKKEYDHILSFLGVEPVDDEWYAKCIQSSNLVVGVPEDVYLELLLFIADNWGPKFHCTTIKYIPLIKFVDLYQRASLCSLSSMRTGEKKVRLSHHFWEVSWLIDWNREFISVASLLFMPKRTQEAIQSCPNKDKLVKWLAEEMKVDTLNVHEYAVCLYNSLGNERKPAVAYAHFLYHSFHKGHISYPEVVDLCGKMPLVNNYGYVIRQKTGVIVPANESKWAGLTDSNLWTEEGYVELGEDYMNPGCFAGKVTEPKQLLEFLKVPTGASDVPYISAPNACIPTVSATLTKQNAFLLLEWIRHLRYQRVHIPEKFLKCIKEGSWLKVVLNGFSASRPPSQSFVLTPSWGNILQNGSAFVDIPLVDQSYYGERIDGYKEELKTIGVMFEFGEACEFIGKHLMSLAASSTLTRGNVLSILQFIKLLRDKCLPPDDFIRSIRKGQWLKTKSHGYRSPVGSVLFDQEWRIASKISDIPFIDQELYGEEIFCFKTELELLGVVVSFKRNYHLIIDHLKSPARLTALTPEAVLLMLQIMLISNSSDKIVEALKGAKCLKTNNGYKSPRECLLFHPEWGCLLQVLSGLPLIDHNFYGSRIFNYRDELRKIGAVVDFEEAAKVFARHFRQASIITKENVSSFLSCYRKLKGTQFRFPADLKSCIREEKWLRTRPGVYRSPRQCILYSPNWDSISPICPLLPFIDDSNNWYGKNIHEYKEELKSLGVVVEFKDGVKFVPSGLQLPKNLSRISRGNALALLECIRILLQEKDYSLPDAFMKEVSQAWLKTGAGYRLPTQCLLFDSKFGEYLKQTDGPFIDVEFYGCKIATYRQELSAIGVIVEAAEGCPLIASQLYLHDEFSTFVRVYNYLSEFKWEPDSEDERWIWIPKGDQNGDWVNPDDCVVYDKDDLFGSQLTVLKNYFEHNLLVFFSRAYRVKSRPSIDDYCELWKAWETSETGLSQDECCKFWRYVSKNWNAKTEKALPEALVKVPVNSGSDEIVLLNKCDVFLPDDLQLKDLFEQSSPDPVFVWYPQPSLPDLPRTTLLEMYRKIGVRTISESVQKEELSLENSVDQQVIPTEKLIGKVLLRLILGFLACPPIEMEAGTRRKAVQGLLSLTVVETTEPITVNYNLPLSSGEILNVRASRKIRWDREMSKFFTQKIDRSGGHKSIVEFATYFSEVISDGVLWEHTDHIPALSELIKLAFVLEFNEEAVDFFMKSKNLQIFIEDEEFLNSAFPSFHLGML